MRVKCCVWFVECNIWTNCSGLSAKMLYIFKLIRVLDAVQMYPCPPHRHQYHKSFGRFIHFLFHSNLILCFWSYWFWSSSIRWRLITWLNNFPMLSRSQTLYSPPFPTLSLPHIILLIIDFVWSLISFFSLLYHSVVCVCWTCFISLCF